MNSEFFRELEEGLIHFRDNLQFELKSEFTFNPKLKKNIFTQEFFLFIPEALQINQQTYSKEQFYRDETSLIRYKTPDFTFEEILNPKNKNCPLNHLRDLNKASPDPINNELIIKESKLFGNIVRSTIRDNIAHIVTLIEQKTSSEKIAHAIELLCTHIVEVQQCYREIQKKLYQKNEDKVLKQNLSYIDEFISDTIDFYFTGLLDYLRNVSSQNLSSSDRLLCDLLKEENIYREKSFVTPKKDEAVLYRQGLLQKFVLEALLLKSNRIAVIQKQAPWFSAVAAGLAMLLYMSLFLFVWESPTLVINSIPFVLSVVFFYILKDRAKEIVKSYYQQKAIRWFPDYRTKIFSPGDIPIGQLSESFSFVDKLQLPLKVNEMRNQGFHDELELLQRHETVIQYRRDVDLFPTTSPSHRHQLNMIFRFNIHRFLEKASNPTISYLTLDPNTRNIIQKQLPKVYHLNLIIKNTHLDENFTQVTEFKKFRVILDKDGIKRVEKVKS